MDHIDKTNLVGNCGEQMGDIGSWLFQSGWRESGTRQDTEIAYSMFMKGKVIADRGNRAFSVILWNSIPPETETWFC